MKKRITFVWGSEKRVRIGKAGESLSLFYEAYRQALAGIAEIVRASLLYDEKEYTRDPFFSKGSWESGQKREAYTNLDLYDYPNNLIAFSGERGTGKSSAMLTFVDGLTDPRGMLFQKDFLMEMVSCELPEANADGIERMLSDSRFIALPPIDPTTLEEGDQILIVILARMFQQAVNTWNETNMQNLAGRDFITQKRLNQRNELMRQFSTCYEHLNAIKGGQKSRPEYPGLDVLADLGDSSRLKLELMELTKQLLQFCCPDAGNQSYLVLQIDDTDMNIRQAYMILEDIRRYLVIPRVIVIMAADLKHLLQVVRSSLLKDYDAGLGVRQEYTDKIARQYITKLFPQTRQINLPSLGAYFKEHTEDIEIYYQGTAEKILMPDGRMTDFPDAQEQIFRLIYRKTGLIFLKQDNRLHYIIPDNMRLHAHFLSMLIQMEDVENPDDSGTGFFLNEELDDKTCESHVKTLRTRLQNVQRFRDYFLSTWVIHNLDNEGEHRLTELERADVAGRVRCACGALEKYLTENEGGTKKSSKNSYTYENMVQLCRHISDTQIDENGKRFVFAVQLYFSLLAHTMVLEDLIDYYERCGQNIRNGMGGKFQDRFGCSFFRLFLVFDNRLLALSNKGNGADSIFVQMVHSKVVTVKEQRIKVCGQCSLDANKIKLSSEYAANDLAVLLYSMIGDYQTEDAFKVNIWNVVTNCLYLGEGKVLTPFVQAMFDNTKSYIENILLEQWNLLRSSALTVALNMDVQEKLNGLLAKKLTDFGKSNLDSEEESQKLMYNNWLEGLGNLYNELVSPFMQQDCAIACLGELRFSGWLEPFRDMEAMTENVIKSLEAFLQLYDSRIGMDDVLEMKKSEKEKIESEKEAQEGQNGSIEETTPKMPMEEIDSAEGSEP